MDTLGLDKIYIQAKRWENTISRPDIQKFAGAVNQKGSKGIFITTSDFTKEALESAASQPNLHLILINGKQLAELMLDKDLGVSTYSKYRMQRINSEYFSDDFDSF